MKKTIQVSALSLILAFTRITTFAWLLFGFPGLSSTENIRLYFDPDTPQIAFAANDIKAVLEKRNHTVQTHPLAALAKDDSGKKIVLAVATDNMANAILEAQGGRPVAGLGAQAYAL